MACPFSEVGCKFVVRAIILLTLNLPHTRWQRAPMSLVNWQDTQKEEEVAREASSAKFTVNMVTSCVMSAAFNALFALFVIITI